PHVTHSPISITPPPPPQLYTLSLHDALPIFELLSRVRAALPNMKSRHKFPRSPGAMPTRQMRQAKSSENAATPSTEQRSSAWFVDRKSTRLNSSHLGSSYAVFCLKEKTPSRS